MSGFFGNYNTWNYWRGKDVWQREIGAQSEIWGQEKEDETLQVVSAGRYHQILWYFVTGDLELVPCSQDDIYIYRCPTSLQKLWSTMEDPQIKKTQFPHYLLLVYLQALGEKNFVSLGNIDSFPSLDE